MTAGAPKPGVGDYEQTEVSRHYLYVRRYANGDVEILSREAVSQTYDSARIRDTDVSTVIDAVTTLRGGA